MLHPRDVFFELLGSGKPLLKGNFGGACWLIELILLSRKVQSTRRKRVFWSRFFFYLFFSKDVIPDSISIKNRSSVHFTSTWSWYDTSYHEAHFLGTIRKNFLYLIPFKTEFQFMLHPRDTMHHLFSIFWVQTLGARLTTPEKASFQWQWRNWFDSFQNRSWKCRKSIKMLQTPQKLVLQSCQIKLTSKRCSSMEGPWKILPI